MGSCNSSCFAEYVLESTIAIAVLDEPVEFKRMDDESSVHVNVVFNMH